jgi:hypothetical protein
MTYHPDTSVPTTDHDSDRTRALPWSPTALPVGLRRLATALGVTWPESHHVRPRGWPTTFNGAYLGWGGHRPDLHRPRARRADHRSTPLRQDLLRRHPGYRTLARPGRGHLDQTRRPSHHLPPPVPDGHGLALGPDRHH